MSEDSTSNQDVRGPARKVLRVVLWPLRALGRVVGWVLVGLVRAYQICVSPWLPRVCRFQPSCSQYMIDAIRLKGPIVGVLKGLWRIVRCNPLCGGGYDPVEKPEPPSDSLGGGE